jgi:hypothetical protein
MALSEEACAFTVVERDVVTAAPAAAKKKRLFFIIFTLCRECIE